MALLEWSDLSFDVGVGKKKRTILSGVAGSLQPNELTCIIGASGSGKTSMMNILSGRIASTTNAAFSANISLDHEPIDPARARSQFAYVMQDDTLYATATPRESIMMAAKLRNVPDPDAAVESVINALGLEKCADNMCGSAAIRGISGGERKRTSVAVEIVSNPRLLFLDEPTSGLDSFAAFNCLTTLKELAQKGHTIALTMHQPSSEIFHLCDKVIFLSSTKVLYSGPVSSVADHFGSLRYPNPPNYNVCDHVTFIMQTLPADELNRLIDAAPSKRANGSAGVAVEQELNTVPFDLNGAKKKYLDNRRSSMFLQIKYLLRREILDVFRDKGAIIARLVMTIFLNALYGVIFLSTADPDQDDYNMEAHFGALTMISIGVMFGSAQPEMLKFPLARPVFIRESASGLYCTLSYLLTKTIVELPVLFVQSLLTFLITYWLVDMNGNFMFLVLSAWLLTLCASSVALLIGAIVNDIKRAMEMGPLVLVPQILFAGFFIRIEQIPTPLDYIQYVCFLKYGLNLILLVEFDDPIIVPCGDTTCNVGDKLLKANSIEKQPLLYIGVLIAIFVIFRLLALGALIYKSKTAVY